MEELARTWKLVRQMLGRWKWEQSYWRKTVFSAPVKMVVNVNFTRLGWYRENIRLHKCPFLLIMSIYKAVLRGGGVPGTYLAAGKCHNSDPFPYFCKLSRGLRLWIILGEFFPCLGLHDYIPREQRASLDTNRSFAGLQCRLTSGW